MSSLLCVQNPSGSVRVYDSDAVKELLFIGENDVVKTAFMPRHRNQLHHKVKKRGVHSSISSSLSSDDAVRSGTASKTTNSTPVTDNTDMMKRQASIDFDNKEKEPLNNLCAPLLDMENTFVKDVDQYLGRVDMLALRKREMLHKTWNSRVFEPLRRKVLQAVYSSDYKETERRHRELYRQYLEYTNKKGFVFLDTMDKGEYYAQALNGHRPAPITVSNDAPLMLNNTREGGAFIYNFSYL